MSSSSNNNNSTFKNCCSFRRSDYQILLPLSSNSIAPLVSSPILSSPLIAINAQKTGGRTAGIIKSSQTEEEEEARCKSIALLSLCFYINCIQQFVHSFLSTTQLDSTRPPTRPLFINHCLCVPVEAERSLSLSLCEDGFYIMNFIDCSLPKSWLFFTPRHYQPPHDDDDDVSPRTL